VTAVGLCTGPTDGVKQAATG